MISTSNFDKLISKLNKVKEKQNNLLDGVAYILGRNTRIRFDKEVNPEDEKWKELSEVTLSMRRNKSRSGTKILQDTGRLKSSINTKVDYKKLEVSVGTNVEYANIHQKGGVEMFAGNSVKIPKREFLGISNQDNKDINRLIDNFVKDLKRSIE